MKLKTLLATAALLLAGAGAAAQAQTPPTDTQLAEGALVTVDDFPSGWRAGDAADVTRVGCGATKHAQQVATGTARSDLFLRGSQREAANAVYVFADAATAQREWQAVSTDTPRCYTKALRKAINAERGLHVHSIKTTDLRLVAAGDQRSGTHVRIAVTARRRGIVVRAVVHVDLVFVTKDRSLSLALFLREDKPFEKALRTQLTDVQAGRLP
jgi:hypothetical protein